MTAFAGGFSPRHAAARTDTALDGALGMLGRNVVHGVCISGPRARLEECMWGRASATPWKSAHVAKVGSRCLVAFAPYRVRADMVVVTQ